MFLSAFGYLAYLDHEWSLNKHYTTEMAQNFFLQNTFLEKFSLVLVFYNH